MNSFYVLVRADDGIGSLKDFVSEARTAPPWLLA